MFGLYSLFANSARYLFNCPRLSIVLRLIVKNTGDRDQVRFKKCRRQISASKES